jgi:hypothetical protein
MNFLGTLAAQQTGELTDVFARELRQQWREFFRALDGSPKIDPDSLSLTSVRFEIHEEEIVAHGTAYFDEIDRGGCADTLIREERMRRFAVFIDKKTGHAYLTDAG